METLVINLFGGPGTGKSTTAAGIFYKLKLAGVNCEMSREFAKEKVWEDSYQVLNDQNYIFGEQFHRLWVLLEKVDIVITDSPLLLSILYYKDGNPNFPKMVASEHRKLNNFNVLLQRVKPYNPQGRVQDEQGAKEKDEEIRVILDNLGEEYFTTPAVETCVDELVNMALRRFGQLNEAM